MRKSATCIFSFMFYLVFFSACDFNLSLDQRQIEDESYTFEYIKDGESVLVLYSDKTYTDEEIIALVHNTNLFSIDGRYSVRIGKATSSRAGTPELPPPHICHYDDISTRTYTHLHWLGWLTWKTCNVTEVTGRCSICGKTTIRIQHEY